LEWKRVKDQAGNPKGFGFATYHSPDSMLRALRVLGGEENYAGIILKAQDGSGTEKKLIVKADDAVRQYLDQYKGSKEPAQLVSKICHAIHSTNYVFFYPFYLNRQMKRNRIPRRWKQ
jgi:RNA recognition motif-containing protein